MTAPAEGRKRSSVVATLREVGIIPVVRTPGAEAAMRVVEALASSGLAVAEITMTVPDALLVIATAIKRFGDRMLIGAGTVTDGFMAERASAVGAQFVVTPCFVPEVIEFAREADLAVIPGALTPTEVLAASRHGGDMVKVFPIQNVGGAAYLRALRGPFPNIPLVPTGGVSLDTVRDMFDAGAAAIGVGGELISREALARRDYASIGALAADFVAAVRVARGR